MKANGPRRIRIRIILLIIPSLYFLTVSAQPDYYFASPTLESGTDLQVGAVYRFPAVKAGFDAKVTIISTTGGISLTSIDETWTGFDEAFQPFIKVDPLTNGYAEFKIDFVNAGTNILASQAEIPITCIDVDGGDQGDGIIYEKDQVQLLNGYFNFNSLVTNVSLIDMGAPGNWIVGENLTGIGYPGVDTTAKDVMFTVVNGNISSLLVRIGARNTSPTGSEIRYRSVYFKKFIYPFSILSSADLLSFKGNSQSDKINLDWTLTTENTVSEIELQRSFSGKDFTTIAAFINNIDGISRTKFSYADLQNTPIVYYRLKLRNASGKTEYSSILSFKKSNIQGVSTVKVFPTVVTGRQFSVSVTADAREESLLQMIDYSGRIVYRKKIELQQGNNTVLINDFNSSLKGNYVVVTKTNNRTHSGKIVIR